MILSYVSAACGVVVKKLKDEVVNIDAANVDDELTVAEYVDDLYKSTEVCCFIYFLFFLFSASLLTFHFIHYLIIGKMATEKYPSPGLPLLTASQKRWNEKNSSGLADTSSQLITTNA